MTTAPLLTAPPSPRAVGSPGSISRPCGDDQHRRHSSLLPPIASVELALDQIAANEVERRVALLVGRVKGKAAAMRVVRMFREPGCAGPQLNLPM